jgi:GGDEF domain-containing protein
LNYCDSTQAIVRVEEFEDRIANCLEQTTRGPLPTTMSGVLTRRDWDIHLVEQLLVAADFALYHAKAEGRNGVKLAQPIALVDLSPQVTESESVDG